MRGLMVAVVGMGILIVAGVTVLVLLMVQRMSAAPLPIASAPTAGAPSQAAVATLAEPAGSRIVGISMGGDRLAVQLGGGGPDRVVIVDTRAARVVGRVELTPTP